VFTVLVALVALPRVAAAQDDCPILQPDCDRTSTTLDDATSTTRDREATTTTEDRGSEEETPTTERRRTPTTEEVVVTSSTLTVTTLHDVLIPGDGTAGAQSTTTSTAELTTGKSGVSDDQLILAVVVALGVIAVVVGVLTYRYWSATRPRVVEAREPQAKTSRSVFLD
jgi:hypothetical protein